MERPCLDEEELLALELPGAPEAAPEALRHLEGCPECRRRAAELRRDTALFEELKGVARPPRGVPEVPGYRLEGELSRGGQGVVHRAVQEGTQRVVALKVLAGRAAPSARERRRFEREVELCSRLSHPGIVTVFDSGVAGGTPWFAMEWVEGETLDAWVARERPGLERRLRLFLELCEAVAHAHRCGVIHRDLKPANVLVDSGGRVRVLDFGTALSTAARRLTAPGEFLGTLAYAAPEQVSGGDESCDTRADVYALGVVLYELVTGALPIPVDGGLRDVVERILHRAPVPPGRARPGLDRDLAAILERALEKEPARRYPSVEAFARDVERHLAHEPVEARPHSAGYVLAKALRRHRRRVAVAALVLVAGGVVAGAFVRERLNARRAGDSAALVRQVFEDILASAAPGRMGGDAPLRDVLALAAKEIDAVMSGAPDAQAAVQLTIGDTYRRLLMFTEAEGHLRVALERFRAVDGDGLETARCLELLGAVLAAQDRPEAVAVQEEALAIRRRLLPADDPRIARGERALAIALVSQLRDADLPRARALLDQALARLQRAPEVDPLEVAETRLALARVANWSLDPSAGELITSALEAFEAAPGGTSDPRLPESLTRYGAWLQVQGRFGEADAALARAEELTRALYGDELTAELLRRRAEVAFAREDLGDAEELSRRALAFDLRRWSQGSPEDADEVERTIAELTAAAPGAVPFRPAFRLLLRFRGQGSFELAGWMSDLARVLHAAGRTAEAEGLLDEALTVRCRAYGADCPVRQRTLVQLGELLLEEGRPADASARLEESLAIAEKHAADGPTAERARTALARCRALEESRP